MPSISSEIDSILREEIELAQKDDPALIVRSAFEVIEDFLRQGMSLERIAAALQKHDINVTKGHLVRHLGIVREERGLRPLKRGRKPASSWSSVQSMATTEPHGQPLPPTKQAVNAPSSAALDAGITSNPTDSALPASALQKPANTHQDRSDRSIDSPTQSGPSQTLFPDEITRLKFIEVQGDWLDVTKMNIDDYLTVTKTLSPGGKIPPGMFEIVAAENRIRGLYERALRKYDEAIATWKSRQ